MAKPSSGCETSASSTSPVRFADLSSVIGEARRTLDVPLLLVAVDYLGLLETTGPTAYEKASSVGRGLKHVAKQEQVAVVAAMQLSRAAGDGSEPVTMTHLRDSGALEESVDALLGMWRPGLAGDLDPLEAAEQRALLRVAILKNRKGKSGRVVDLYFRADSRRVYEPADEAL